MHPLWCDTKTNVRVVRLLETDEINGLVRLFETVAEVEGWQPEGALRLWIDRSVYFALDVNGQLAGGLQIVLPDSRGRLPCQLVWPKVTMDSPNCTAHVAILALDRPFRGKSTLFWSLGIEMWRFCVEQGIAQLYIEVTPRVLPLYRRLGWPLTICGDLRPHWGEDCYLCSLGVSDVAEVLVRRAGRSVYYRQIVAQAFRMTFPGQKSDGDSPAAAYPIAIG